MKLIIRESEKGAGAFADVFFDKSNSKVYKLFKSFQYPLTDRDGFKEDSYNEYRKKVFESEKEAYIIAINNLLLRGHVPLLHYTPIVSQVFDKNGNDISKYYLLDCCLVLDYIPGESVKVGHINNKDEFNKRYSVNIDEIIGKMHLAGIGFTEDMNVIMNDDSFKLIDFAVDDFNKFQPVIWL